MMKERKCGTRRDHCVNAMKSPCSREGGKKKIEGQERGSLSSDSEHDPCARLVVSRQTMPFPPFLKRHFHLFLNLPRSLFQK